MTNNDQSLFNIIHSLPVITHSIAVATRSPAYEYGQATKYMPDYGGVLEAPGSKLKNNTLAEGIPLKTISHTFPLQTRKRDGLSGKSFCRTRCLAVTSHLKSCDDNLNSVLRALGNHLHLDLLKNPFNNDTSPSLEKYAHTIYKDPIRFIKYETGLPKSLPIGFSRYVKVIQLDESYDPQMRSDCLSHNEFSTIAADTSNLEIKDACLSCYNPTFLSVASDNIEECQVKIYDMSHSQHSFYTLSFPAPSKVEMDLSTLASPIKLRNSRTIRRFVLTKPSKRGVQQIDNIPSHLVNMLLTNDYQTALVDPRSDKLGHIYVDRTKIPSFFPVEYLRRTSFSSHNQYQFYSLSNVHLRVFDTRFIGTPVNQLNHMLDSDSYNFMDIKSIKYNNNKVETLCLSSPERICFASFDQAQGSYLVNPKSTHPPFHDDLASDRLYGMDIHIDHSLGNNATFFNVMQLSNVGDIYLKRYVSSEEKRLELVDGFAKSLVKEAEIRDCPKPLKQTLRRVVNRLCKTRKQTMNESSSSILDIVDMKLHPFDSCSKRATDRYNKMLSKLDWC